MPYFKKNDPNVNLLFIHIPKTGGSSLELYFSSKFNIPLNNKSLFHLIKDEQLLNKHLQINSCLQHMTYNEIDKYSETFGIDFDGIVIITIVRNPYERIISDFFYFNLITVDSTKETVLNILKTYMMSNNYDNHSIPQHKFITNDKGEIIQNQNIHILKTESLTADMKQMGFIDFNLFENANAHKVDCFDYLNDESIAIVNEVYHLDFVLFNYAKI